MSGASLTSKDLNDARTHKTYLVTGTVSKSNKTFDQGLVVGSKQKWKKVKRTDKKGNQKKRWTWVSDKEFKQPLKIDLKGAARYQRDVGLRSFQAVALEP